jgi:hypothetical protein
MRHHIVVELPVYQDWAPHEGARQDEADAPTLSESLQRQLEPRLSRAFNADLTLTPDTIDVPWFDCSSLPEGRIQPWWHHYISAVKTRQQKWTDKIPAGRSFNAFVDVHFENTGNYTYESVMAHGVVVPRATGDSRPAPDQSRTASDVGGLSWKAPSGERAQDILQSSPMFAPYLGSDGSGLLVVEKGHGLTRYAPWGDAGRAENFAVVGSSGSGKSFLGREIAASAYVEGKRLRIVDGFDYYEYMHRVLDAPTYRLDPKAPISLNPFSGISTEAELERLLPALSSLVLELADQQDDEGLEYVSIAVREAWLLAGEQLDLSYISSNIASRAGTALERVQDSLDKLLASCGKWLSGLPGIPLSPRALLIDTQALSHGHGEAHRCALKLIMGLLHREALADGNAVHLYDEIFHIRPTDWYARRLVADCNKKGVSIGIFGQDLRSEILLSGLGQAVCATSPSYLTSHLRPQCREQLQWHIGLTESEVAEIESCGWRLGDFSVVKDGKLRGQFQFLVDPLTRAAYSTQYETIDALRKLMENSGLSYREALRHVGG